MSTGDRLGMVIQQTSIDEDLDPLTGHHADGHWPIDPDCQYLISDMA